MNNLKDKVFLITGSTKGLGKTFAIEILSRGGLVVINGRNREQLEATRIEFSKAGFDPLAIAGDMTDPAICKQIVDETVKKFGKLDVLVNNAGLPMRGRFEQMQPAIMKEVIDVNLMSAIYCTMAALPEIKKSKGSIIFISSLAAVRGIPNASPYSIAKMGLTAMAQSLRVELAGTGVHVGLLLVGLVENRPDKTVLNYDGKYIPVSRKGKQSQMSVTNSLLRMIEKEQSILTLTPFGKFYRFLHWLAPWSIHKYLVKTQFSEQYK